MKKYLPIGGLVAAGFDPTGSFLLTITHSGRGVFCTRTWERVARDGRLAYPEGIFGIGIGPIEGLRVPVERLDSDHECVVTSHDSKILLRCESSGIAISVAGE